MMLSLWLVNRRLSIVMTVFVLAIPLGQAKSANDHEIVNGFYREGAVVTATVVELKPLNPRSTEFVMRVDHVFAGPQSLKGRTFSGTSQQPQAVGISAGSDRVFEIAPPLQLEEQFLWCVGLSTNSNGPIRPGRNCFAVSTPCRRTKDLRSEAAFNWAMSLERLAATPKNEQLTILKDFAGSEFFETSYWAVAILRKEWGNRAEQVLQEIIKLPKLCPAAITELDVALQEIKGANWFDSNQRWPLLERSLRNVESPDECKLVLEYWSRGGWYREATSSATHQVFQIVNRALAETACTDRIRNRLFSDVLRSAFLRAQDDSAIWNLAIENIEHPINAQVAGNAAFMLMDARNRTPRRFRTLLKLYRDEKDPGVANQLGKVLAKWHDGDQK